MHEITCSNGREPQKFRIKSLDDNRLQIAIDNAKRTFDVDLNSEIKRIKEEINVKENGLPLFWFYRKEKSKFKSKNPEGKKMMKGYNPSLSCPMNYVCEMQYARSKHQKNLIPLKDLFVYHKIDASRKKNKRVEMLIEELQIDFFERDKTLADWAMLEEHIDEVIEHIRHMYIPSQYAGLFAWLLNRALVLTVGMKRSKESTQTNIWRNRPLLMKVLYEANKEAFLSCFSNNQSISSK